MSCHANATPVQTSTPNLRRHSAVNLSTDGHETRQRRAQGRAWNKPRERATRYHGSALGGRRQVGELERTHPQREPGNLLSPERGDWWSLVVSH